MKGSRGSSRAMCGLLCRWGYDSVGELEEVVANYSAAQIPLEAAW